MAEGSWGCWEARDPPEKGMGNQRGSAEGQRSVETEGREAWASIFFSMKVPRS